MHASASCERTTIVVGIASGTIPESHLVAVWGQRQLMLQVGRKDIRGSHNDGQDKKRMRTMDTRMNKMGRMATRAIGKGAPPRFSQHRGQQAGDVRRRANMHEHA